MIEIIKAVFCEKIKNKTIYILCLIGIAVPTFLMLNGNVQWDGRRIDDFRTLAPIAIGIINFFACLYAILLSVNTIPAEIERKTGDLILIRGIKYWQYIFSLTISNVLISMTSLVLLSAPLVILALTKGSVGELPGIAGSIGIIFLNVAVLSVITSLLSKFVSVTFAGFFGILVYFLGVFHDTISTAVRAFDNLGSRLIQYLMYLIPNIAEIQKQAGSVLKGVGMDLSPLTVQMFYLYILLAIVILSSRRGSRK